MNKAINENKTEAREAAFRQLFPSIRGQSSSHSAASASVSVSRATNAVFRGHRPFVDPVVHLKLF